MPADLPGKEQFTLGTGRAILRGIKLTIYGFAGIFVCLVIYNVMTLAPEAKTPGVRRAVDAAAVPVPPPPPLK